MDEPSSKFVCCACMLIQVLLLTCHCLLLLHEASLLPQIIKQIALHQVSYQISLKFQNCNNRVSQSFPMTSFPWNVVTAEDRLCISLFGLSTLLWPYLWIFRPMYEPVFLSFENGFTVTACSRHFLWFVAARTGIALFKLDLQIWKYRRYDRIRMQKLVLEN